MRNYPVTNEMKKVRRVWVGASFCGDIGLCQCSCNSEKHVFGLAAIRFRLKQLVGNCTGIAQN
jgi:hypothetical protein